MVGFESGNLVYFERESESPFYRRKWEDDIDDGGISCIAWNPRQDRAVFTVKRNQIYLISIESDQKVR